VKKRKGQNTEYNRQPDVSTRQWIRAYIYVHIKGTPYRLHMVKEAWEMGGSRVEGDVYVFYYLMH
jgi:hypothetical protein